MYNSQIIAVLKTFTTQEAREFKKWLQSPFHNQREDVIQLFEYLTQNNNLEKEKNLSKAKIYSKLFPGESFDDAKIRQTIHFLQKQIDEYLTYTELHQNETACKIALLRAFRKKNLEKFAVKSIKTISELQEKYPYLDFNFLWNQYLFQQEVYEFSTSQSKGRTSQINLQEVVDALDKVYFASRIKQSCAMMAHKNVFKTEYSDGLIGEIIDFVSKNSSSLLTEPAISFYYYGYLTYPSVKSENSEASFFELKNNILELGHLFPLEEIQDILTMASNYCIRCINQGKSAFVQEAFDLYKYGVENKILFNGNKQGAKWDFMNITRVGSQLEQQFTWVENFIENYQEFLDERERDNVVHFCKAKLYYAEGNYDDSMVELSKVKEDDVLLNLSAKHTLLKIYYEKDEIEALESLMDSMAKYIKRKDVPSNYRMVYENIIKLTRKISRINPYNKDQMNALKQEIEKAPALPYSEREWLIKQVTDMQPSLKYSR